MTQYLCDYFLHSIDNQTDLTKFDFDNRIKTLQYFENHLKL